MGYIRKIDNIPPITLDTKQLGWLLYCALDISIKNRFGDRINRQYQEKKIPLMKNNPKGFKFELVDKKKSL